MQNLSKKKLIACNVNTEVLKRIIVYNIYRPFSSMLPKNYENCEHVYDELNINIIIHGYDNTRGV